MSKSLKLENDTYIDSSSIVHNREVLKNYLEYQDGEKMVNTKGFTVAGLLTASKTSIQFSVPVGKSMANIKNITINKLKVNIRHSDGGYIYNQVDLVGETDITLKASIATNNMITFSIASENAYDFTNNAPVSVYIYEKNFDITFNT